MIEDVVDGVALNHPGIDHQTCQDRHEGSRKKEYSIYFGSDKRIDLLIYGVEQIMVEWKFLSFFIQSFFIT